MKASEQKRPRKPTRVAAAISAGAGRGARAGGKKAQSDRLDKQAFAERIFSLLDQSLPNPQCELFYQTPYQLLVSVVLSAQTTDKMVNLCMQPVYEQGFDPQRMREMGEAAFQQVIKRIGLAPTKAKNVTRLTEMILTQHDGQVPGDRAALEALPGVGRKTANVVLGEIFGHPTMAVDTHVFRVSGRLGLHAESTPDRCEAELLRVVSPKRLPKAHHQLIHHGRYVCKAQKPECAKCILADLCPSAASFDR